MTIVPEEYDLATPTLEDCWFLTGPTASGKTRIGLVLAERLGAEIISLDSMALYRGMDIGTAKPTPAEQALAPHHMLDVVDPTEDYSLSRYVEEVARLAGEIRQRGREVLLVGGTPLYLKSLLRGIFQGPPADWEFRREVEAEAARVGNEALHERLAQVDPLSAAKLHPNNQRRIIRALEVHRLTGQPISHLQLQFEEGRPAEACKVFRLEWPRPELHRRIDARVDRMFEAGLIEEVKGLLREYGELSRTAAQAVGYREVLEHLEGNLELEETIIRVRQRTRQFAKRQETWFRHLSECRSLPRTQDDDPAELAERMIAEIGASRA